MVIVGVEGKHVARFLPSLTMASPLWYVLWVLISFLRHGVGLWNQPERTKPPTKEVISTAVRSPTVG